MKKKYIAPANVVYNLCLKDSVLNNLSIIEGETVTDDEDWDTQKKDFPWESDEYKNPW